MKCETPARSSRSSREPAPIQNPSETERTLATFSEITRSPESSSERTYFCTGRSYPGGSLSRAPSPLGDELQAAAAPLGFVERGVREPEERLRLAGVLRARGDTEARADADARLGHAAYDLACVVLGGLGEEQCELVAADPKCVVAPPQCGLQRASEALQRLIAREVSELVVQLLEAVEIAEHEPERAAVPRRARDLPVEAVDERAAIEQPRERIVVGEEAQLAHVRRGHDRRSRLVREHAKSLKLVAGGKQAVVWLVGPEDADHLAETVVQRDEQPVVLPRPRAAPVLLGHVRLPGERQPARRLVVREQVAALDLEHGVEQPFDVAQEHRLALRVLDLPAHGGARIEPPLAVAKRREDVLESERVAYAGTHRAQDLVGDRLCGQPRRHGEQPLERYLVTGRVRRLLRSLDRERRV